MQTRKYMIIVFIFFLALSIFFSSCTSGSKENTDLFISAAASLTDVMEELKVLFEEQNNKITLTMNYGSSGALRQQIEHGAPVDVFVSADQAQMDALEKQELIIPGSRLDLLENAVVLITPKDVLHVESFEDLTNDAVKRIGIGEPQSVPAGRYAKEVLKSFNLWDDLENKLILAKDVRQVLTWVETGNVDAGVVYMTDALTADINIISVAPSNFHTPVIYPAATISRTRHKQAASEFIMYLTSREASEVFLSHGFKIITGK